MKYITKTMAVVSACALMYSCTDLEEDLIGDITNDVEVAGVETGGPGGGSDPISGAFSQLRSAGTANHGGYFSVQTVSSDEAAIGAKGGDWFDGGIWLDVHKHTQTSSNGPVAGTWSQQYSAIAACNDALQNTDLNANQVAQLKVLRAFFYYRLCDLYGRVKIVTAPGQDPAQSTRTEVFNFIESELLDALGVASITSSLDLSNSDLTTENNPYRVNQFAALGLLAKLYLNAEVYTGTARWQEAADAASYVVDNSGAVLATDANYSVTNLGKRPAVDSDPDNLTGYAAVFAPNNEDNPEMIWSVAFDEATGSGMNFGQMSLHYSSQFTWNFQDQPWNGYSALEDFYNSYEAGDARKANNFIVGTQLDYSGSQVLDFAAADGNIELAYTPSINELAPNSARNGGARFGKFSYKQFGRPEMSNDYPIIRLGDMILVKGEAEARAAGDWSLALEEVNEIRGRAGVSAMTALTADDFLAERGREMFMEVTRRQDLIRFGEFESAWWEKSDSDPNKRLFPIPAEQITASGGTLTQNPGY